MREIEIERTYLANYLPKDLDMTNGKEILDIYFPINSENPKLRLRKSGDKFILTKKRLLNPNDPSIQFEDNIELTFDEYTSLIHAEGNRVRKIRYIYEYQGRTAEINIFQDDLVGLVLVDFEFNKEEEIMTFKKPDFCGADVTKEDSIAGGYLAGKSLADIRDVLKRYNYKSI